jgi:methyl-accepting chemotaxis protein
VRNLAQRSATAAKEIKTLIRDSVAKVEHGSGLVNQSGQTLQEIVGSVKRVTDIIAEMAAAAAEQSSGIDQVNRAVTQMDQSVQSNASQTAELTVTARSLAVQGQQLQTLVGRFRLTDTPAGAAPARPAARPAITPPPARPPIERRSGERGSGERRSANRGAGDRAPERDGREPGSPPPSVASAFPTNGRGATNGHGDDGFQEF